MSSIGRENTYIDIDIDLNLMNDLNSRVSNLENNVGLPSIPNLRDATFLNAKVENVEKADTIVPHYDKAYTYYVLLDDKHEVATNNEHKNISVNNFHNSNLNEIVEKILTDVEVLKIQNKLTSSMITQAGFGKGDTRIQSGPTTRITFNTRDLSSLGINTANIPVFDGTLSADNVEEKLTAFIEYIEHEDNLGLKQLLDVMGLNTNDLNSFLEEMLKAQDPLTFLESILLSRVYIGTEGDLYINANPIPIADDVVPIWLNLNQVIPAMQLELGTLAIEEGLIIGETTWGQFRDSLFGAGTVGIGSLVVALATLVDQIKRKADRIWDEGNLLTGTSGNIYQMSSGSVAIGIPKPIVPPLLPGGNSLANKLEVNGNINIHEGFQYKINNAPLAYTDLASPLLAGTNIEIVDNTIKSTYTYTLPTASDTELGGVKVDNETITIENGVISGAYTYTLPTASDIVLGGVKVDGSTIKIDATSGVISSPYTYTLPTASDSVLGGVKVDNSTITIEDGIISSPYTYTLPKATTSSLGGVQIGNNIDVNDGVISLPKATYDIIGGVKIGNNINVNDGVISVALPLWERALFQNSPIDNIYYTAGNVMIGTNSAFVVNGQPNTDGDTKLHIQGNINITGTYKINGNDLKYNDLTDKIPIRDFNSGPLPNQYPANYAFSVDGITIRKSVNILDAHHNMLYAVQPDWNQNLIDGPGYIHNKPTLFNGNYNSLSNKLTSGTNIEITPGNVINNTYELPKATASILANGSTGTLGGVMVDNITIQINPINGVITAVSHPQANWLETNVEEKSFIRNKPTIVNSKWTNATDTSTNIYYNSGNVGVGITTAINNKLEVGGNLNISAGSKYKINNVNLAFSDLGGTLSYNSLTDKLTGGTNINIIGNAINNTYTYTLPTATTGTLGGVKVDGTTITINASGVISGANTYTLPTASTTTLGGVKVDGSTITINGSGVISGANTYTLPTATTATIGGVRVDGTTITINGSGVISGANTYTLPTASTTILGGVKVDGSTITINGSGVISGANTYTLPTASTLVLGGVKVGSVWIIYKCFNRCFNSKCWNYCDYYNDWNY
jgi:hypothetical protein